jgi:hypothetical protein
MHRRNEAHGEQHEIGSEFRKAEAIGAMLWIGFAGVRRTAILAIARGEEGMSVESLKLIRLSYFSYGHQRHSFTRRHQAPVLVAWLRAHPSAL